MISYTDRDHGLPVLVFRPDNRDELNALKIWCRANIGRSHGPGVRSWWIRRVSPPKLGMKSYDELLMTTGPYIFLAQLTWA
jgi:hypothetical protein